MAIEVAGVVDDLYHHGAAFCDLVAMPSDELLEATVTDAVGIHQPAGSGDRQLVDHLVNREMLLVIDNADHAVGVVATLAESLLEHCARLRVLVTSREPLRVVGERLVRLQPLSTNHGEAPAVQLLVDRAALAGARGPLDLDAVAQLCSRLDGLPLAIELAASRLRSVPLEHLGPATTGTHDTLQGVVDWSIDALPTGQQALLRRLAVFAGGCTADVVGAVCEPGDDPIEALADLVDRSLLQLDDAPAGARYRLLEPIRADGLARLAEAGEFDRIHARHLTWCLSMTPADLGHGEDPTIVDTLGTEIDNVVSALAWGLSGGDVSAATRLAIAAACHWVYAGRLGDARGWLERAAEATTPSTGDHRASLRRLGWVLARQSDLTAARSALEAAIAPGPSGATDVEVIIDAEILLATVEIEAGDVPAGEARLRRLAEAPEVAVAPARRALISHGLGRRALVAGDLPLASELLEQAVVESRAAGMWYSLALGLAGVAQVEAGRRHLQRAEGAFAEALAVTRGHRLMGLLPRILGAGAVLASRSGDSALARSRFVETLSAARVAGDIRAELATLTNLGAIDHNEGHPMNAIAHLEEALALADRINDERIALRVLANLAESVLAGPHDTRRAIALSAEALVRARPLGLRISEVTAVESGALALVERDEPGDLVLAATMVGAAAAEREALDYALDAEEASLARARAMIADVIGVAAAEEAVTDGRRRGLDAVADELLATVG